MEKPDSNPHRKYGVFSPLGKVQVNQMSAAAIQRVKLAGAAKRENQVCERRQRSGKDVVARTEPFSRTFSHVLPTRAKYSGG